MPYKTKCISVNQKCNLIALVKNRTAIGSNRNLQAQDRKPILCDLAEIWTIHSLILHSEHLRHGLTVCTMAKYDKSPCDNLYNTWVCFPNARGFVLEQDT